MPDTFTFELVAPEKLLVSKAVAMVTVPGSEGAFGVLPDHAPMVATLQAGVIFVCEQNTDAVTERLFIAGGFAEVTAERLVVLAEEALPVADLDPQQLQQQAKDLTEDLAAAQNAEERTTLEKELALVQAKRAALSR